jgi:inhibitor of KinA
MQPVMLNNPGFEIYYLSEQAITIEFGNQISGDTLQQITGFNALLHQQPFQGFISTVLAYTTLTVFFNPSLVIKSPLPGKDCFTKVSNYLQLLKIEPSNQLTIPKNLITIPVCYGGTFGPDLEELASLHHLTTQEVINLHSSAVYKVYMIGFVPGFAYLGGMNSQLATPRKPIPRSSIPSGSVGIAGEQTGIYPLETPGGWQLIGQTPLLLFDAKRLQPALLKPGDEVKFAPISYREFNRYHA